MLNCYTCKKNITCRCQEDVTIKRKKCFMSKNIHPQE